MIQILSHSYMTVGKAIALTVQTFVGKVMSLHFNTLSRFVIAFLSRSKCLLISRLQSLSMVILDPKNLFLNIWVLCRWYSQIICFFKLSVFREVSGSKQNREAGIEFSHVSFSFTCEQPPPSSTSSPQWSVCYIWWICTDTSQSKPIFT